MVDIESALRPLVDRPPSAPRPVAEIAARARRRRVRRRSVTVTALVGVLAAVGTVASLGSPAHVTTVDRPTEPPTSEPAPPETTATTTTPPTTASTAPDAPAGERPAPTTAPPSAPTSGPPGAADAVPTGPRDPFGLVEAEAYDAQQGVVTEAMPGGGHKIGAVADGDHVAFHDVSFGTSLATRFEARIASGAGPGVEGLVEVRLDDVASPPFATIVVTGTGGWNAFATLAVDTPAIGGTHDVYVTFASAQSGDFADVDWFRFLR